MTARDLDHLVLAVRDLDLAERRFRALGFTVTPPGDHPFGTRNRLVLLENAFIELLAVANPAAIPPGGAGAFSFGAHNQAFLAEGEGISMLAFTSADGHGDARQFASRGLGAYAPIDFSRDAVLPDGRRVRVAFSLAFATTAALPGLAFFTCQHRQARDLLWQPRYQDHANGARAVIETVLAVDEPAVHGRFFEQLTGAEPSPAPGGFSLSLPQSRLAVLTWDEVAKRFPECAAHRGAPRFVAYAIAVSELAAVEASLRAGNIRYRSRADAVVIAPTTAFGAAIEFVRLPSA